jgi:hypothetical protein
MNWYDKYIEEPIRDLVRLLRDNGFNTECSCGHKMYVQCQYITDDGAIARLDKLLYSNGYCDYEISMILIRSEGYIASSSVEVTISEIEKENNK